MNEDNQKSKFIEFLRTKEKNEKSLDEEVVKFLKNNEIPTPHDVTNVINSRVGSQRQYLLHHHVYWKERQLRLGLESLIRAAHQAYIDLCRHDAALGSLARARDFEDHVDQTIGYAAQKDMVAYCSLVVGVLETLRRIKKLRPDIMESTQNIIEECFDHDVTIFIKDMRKNLAHGSVVIPEWEISSDFQSVSGSMKYEKRKLLRFGDWSVRSKTFLSNASDTTIHISKVVGEHFKILDEFGRKMLDLFARNVTDTERDFFWIEDSYKRIGRRQWAKILISQIGKEKNPYEYLHRFFDPETVREILRRPRHSKEQVDLILAIKSAEFDCNDDLRRLLYEKFQATDDSSS